MKLTQSRSRRACALSFVVATVAGCPAAVRTSSPSRGATVSQPPALAEVPPEPRPAFVVITADATWVLPVDPTLEAVRLPGMFVGDPSSPGVAYGRFQLGVGAETNFDAERLLPWCPDAGPETSCFRELGETEAATANVRLERQPDAEVIVENELPCACVAIKNISTDPAEPYFDLTDPEVLEMIEMSPYSPEEYAENCGPDTSPEPLIPTSVLDGVLYETGTFHNNSCSGRSLYDGAYETVSLRPDAVAREQRPGPPMQCIHDGAGFGDGLDLPGVRPGADPDCMYGEEDCDECRIDGEMSAFANQSGHLVIASADVDSVGSGCACAHHQPLSPLRCPGALEPCGDVSAFDALSSWPDYWVATDGSAALGVDSSKIVVLRAGLPESPRIGPGITSILGVEFHADAVLLDAPELPSLVGVSLPPLDASDQGKQLDSRDWGNRCFQHLKADRLVAAEAACVEGLRDGGSPQTRGALVYNLGRVAEARGDDRRALAFYDRSIRLRPGVGEVEARISKLRAAQ